MSTPGVSQRNSMHDLNVAPFTGTQQAQQTQAKEPTTGKLLGDLRTANHIATDQAKPPADWGRIALRVGLGFFTLGASELVRYKTGQTLTGHGKLFLSMTQGQQQLDRPSREKHVEEFKEANPEYRKFTIKLGVTTSDGAKLDGAFIEPNPKSGKPREEQKYVIWLNGFGQSYESKLNPAVKYANEAQANIVLFNYRGAGDSEGIPMSANDFVKDTLAMTEFLTQKLGVDPKNIVIHGHSMGGGIGAQAATHLDGVRHINDRSFDAFSKATKAGVEESIGGTAGKILGGIVGGAIKHTTGFELNTKKTMRQEESGELHNIRERTLIVHHEHDEVMGKNALHNVVVQGNLKASHNVVTLKTDADTLANLVGNVDIKKLTEPHSYDFMVLNIKTPEEFVGKTYRELGIKGSPPNAKATEKDYINYLASELKNAKLKGEESPITLESIKKDPKQIKELSVDQQARFKAMNDLLRAITPSNINNHALDITTFTQFGAIAAFVKNEPAAAA